jgi:hypothetical protein
MSGATPSRLAGGGVLLGLAAAGAWLVAFDAFAVLTFLSYALVGTYLVVRRPRNAVGWLLIVLGWLNIATTSNASEADVATIDAGTASLAAELRFWVGPALGSLSFVAYAALAFVFPSGSLPRARRGRWIGALLLGATIIVMAPAFLVSLQPYQVDGTREILVRNPFVIAPVLDPLGASGLAPAVVTLVPIATLAVAVVDAVRRYRAGDEILRLQLRWLMAASAFVVVAVVLGLVTFVTLAPVIGALGWLPAQVSFALVPLAVGAAVLRYRLFEIDRIVSRTIAWVLVTLALAAVFAGGIVALSAALHDLTDGDTLAVAASTLMAAVLFQPLRRRVQGAVDRRFDRARVDGERLAATFAERLRSEVDLPRLLDGLTTAVEEGVRPTGAGVWLRPTDARP